MPISAPRSYLFVPGNRPTRFTKAYASGADAVIVDLEDAVPPAEKAEARDAVSAWLSSDRPVWVRINGTETAWYSEDAELCRLPGVAGVVLPKAERAAQIEQLFEKVGNNRKIAALIETAAEFKNMEALTGTNRLHRLMFGSIDFQVDLGIRGDGEELLYFRSQIVLASRLANLPQPVDGVTTSVDSVEPLRANTERARRLGFGGKLCIHPNQVGVVNACFIPTEEEQAWAHRVKAAIAEARGAAIVMDGKMVDAPVALQAERVLASLREFVDQAPRS